MLPCIVKKRIVEVEWSTKPESDILETSIQIRSKLSLLTSLSQRLSKTSNWRDLSNTISRSEMSWFDWSANLWSIWQIVRSTFEASRSSKSEQHCVVNKKVSVEINQDLLSNQRNWWILQKISQRILKRTRQITFSWSADQFNARSALTRNANSMRIEHSSTADLIRWWNMFRRRIYESMHLMMRSIANIRRVRQTV